MNINWIHAFARVDPLNSSNMRRVLIKRRTDAAAFLSLMEQIEELVMKTSSCMNFQLHHLEAWRSAVPSLLLYHQTWFRYSVWVFPRSKQNSYFREILWKWKWWYCSWSLLDNQRKFWNIWWFKSHHVEEIWILAMESLPSINSVCVI